MVVHPQGLVLLHLNNNLTEVLPHHDLLLEVIQDPLPHQQIQEHPHPQLNHHVQDLLLHLMVAHRVLLPLLVVQVAQYGPAGLLQTIMHQLLPQGAVWNQKADGSSTQLMTCPLLLHSKGFPSLIQVVLHQAHQEAHHPLEALQDLLHLVLHHRHHHLLLLLQLQALLVVHLQDQVLHLADRADLHLHQEEVQDRLQVVLHLDQAHQAAQADHPHQEEVQDQHLADPLQDPALHHLEEPIDHHHLLVAQADHHPHLEEQALHLHLLAEQRHHPHLAEEAHLHRVDQHRHLHHLDPNSPFTLCDMRRAPLLGPSR